MKVKELIEKLKDVDPESLVVMSSDPEGNHYSTLYNFWEGAYDSLEREVGLYELTKDDIDEGYTEEDVMEDGVKAIILTPTN